MKCLHCLLQIAASRTLDVCFLWYLCQVTDYQSDIISHVLITLAFQVVSWCISILQFAGLKAQLHDGCLPNINWKWRKYNVSLCLKQMDCKGSCPASSSPQKISCVCQDTPALLTIFTTFQAPEACLDLLVFCPHLLHLVISSSRDCCIDQPFKGEEYPILLIFCNHSDVMANS